MEEYKGQTFLSKPMDTTGLQIHGVWYDIVIVNVIAFMSLFEILQMPIIFCVLQHWLLCSPKNQPRKKMKTKPD